jgi:hypothetical protein
VDAIEVLLQDKRGAEKLLNFHRNNRTFLPHIAGELLWLIRNGRKAGGVSALIHFLRWDKHWRAVDEFEVNQNLAPLAIRVCILLWPDINGTVRLAHCAADDILGTDIVRSRRRRYGNRLRPTAKTGSSWVGARRPEVPEINRTPSFHEKITTSDTEQVGRDFARIVSASPDPTHSLLRTWLDHVNRQPEVFFFMARTLRERCPTDFSGESLYEYTRWSILRAVEIRKRFTLPDNFRSLYCRALIILNPEFNGRCEFKEDSRGEVRPGRANRLLGCTLAPEPINGEPYRRLQSPKVGQSRAAAATG